MRRASAPTTVGVFLLAVVVFTGWSVACAQDGFYVIAIGKKAKRTVLVSPQSTPSESGIVLLNALNAVADASADKPYLIIIEPGLYDIGSGILQMKPYVDIQGSGEDVTRIKGNVNESQSGVLMGADNAELRFLTVENYGGSGTVTAIYNSSTSPSLTHVTALASGGTSNYAIYNFFSSSPSMNNVTAAASGGTNSCGIYSSLDSSPTMNNVTASATGASSSCKAIANSSSTATINNVTATASDAYSSYGIYNDSSISIMTNVTVDVSKGTLHYGVYNSNSSAGMSNVTATVSGGYQNCGVENTSCNGVTMSNVMVIVSGGTDSNYGVLNLSSTPNINNLSAIVSGTNSHGVHNASSSTCKIDHSVIFGSVNTVFNASGSTAYIGNSRLEGGAVGGPGTKHCAGVYDETYKFYPDSCP